MSENKGKVFTDAPMRDRQAGIIRLWEVIGVSRAIAVLLVMILLTGLPGAEAQEMGRAMDMEKMSETEEKADTKKMAEMEKTTETEKMAETEKTAETEKMTETEKVAEMKTIYFAGGCFWGMERLMELVPGVVDAESGYAQGNLEKPTYEQVCRGDTGHRETVKVSYDPSKIGLGDLLRLFFSVIDPTVKDRQANDVGSQYQTGVYWSDASAEEIILAAAEREKAKHSAFHVEMAPLTVFWPAEDYHQDYLVKNPLGYCHIGPDDFDKARHLTKQGE